MTDRASATNKRWAQRPTNRNTADPKYPNEWYWQQCGGCAHYYPLTGPLGDDWGACTGPDSPFDGQLRFEHDGCDHFEADTSGRAPFGRRD